jgi:TrmH family RNA methyltransferase
MKQHTKTGRTPEAVRGAGNPRPEQLGGPTRRATAVLSKPDGNARSKLQAGLQRIAGRHNPRLKELRMAFRRGELTAAGECAIEGIKLVEEALRSGQRVTGIFFSESAQNLADKLLPQVSTRVEPMLLPDSLFRSLVPSDSPQGVAALVRMRRWSLEQLLERSEFGVFVVAAGIQDPGNFGTILRSAEAFGTAGVFITEGNVSPYNSKVLRGSAGSIFRQPFVQMASAELIPILRARGMQLLATSSHKGTPLPGVSWQLPAAIFIGNEGVGLSRDLMHQMVGTIAIPHAAQVESLNAGVAASIVLYEASKFVSSQSPRDRDESRP